MRISVLAIYVRRSVCTYVYMYVRMSESNYACACVGPKVIMYVRTSVCTHVCE